MNCKYCNKPLLKDFLNDSPGGSFDCLNCDVSFFMRHNCQPYLISFNFDNHQIDLDYDTNSPATRLFELIDQGYDDRTHNLLLRLPHIIPIDPAHKDYWLHKLLGLKVYY